jgi:hypothetical protein
MGCSSLSCSIEKSRYFISPETGPNREDNDVEITRWAPSERSNEGCRGGLQEDNNEADRRAAEVLPFRA